LPSHSVGSECKSERDGEGKTFGNGSNDKDDGNDECLDEFLTLFIRSSIGNGSEFDKESDEQSEEEETSGGGTDVDDELSETIKLDLKWGSLGLSLHSYDN
jgi:hypothetical protein